MANKKIFTIGIFSLALFIGIATYLWYIYFEDYEDKLVANSGGTGSVGSVELINNGGSEIKYPQ